MDNNEEIILPKKNSKISSAPANEQKKPTNKPLIIALVLAGVFIVVLVAAIIILINKNSNSDSNNNSLSEEETTETVEAETVYVTPEGVEDAEAAYQEYLDEQKSKAETSEEIFDAELTIINNKIANEEYDEALSRLDAISRDGLSTEQLFRLYNVYTRVFEGTGDTARYDEYVTLRTEQRNLLVTEE